MLHDANTTYAAMSRAIGISKNGLTYWERNGNLPSGDVLSKIAAYLGVDVADLLSGQKNALESDEQELLDVFRGLSLSGKRQLLGKAYELRDAQKNAADEITPPDVDLAAALVDGRIGVKK